MDQTSPSVSEESKRENRQHDSGYSQNDSRYRAHHGRNRHCYVGPSGFLWFVAAYIISLVVGGVGGAIGVLGFCGIGPRRWRYAFSLVGLCGIICGPGSVYVALFGWPGCGS